VGATLDERAIFAGVRVGDVRRITILDRYLVREFTGPFVMGLAAFTLIFVATQILAIGKLVSEQHAPLAIALEYFLWDMPHYLIFAIPMAVLFGTLLTMQRLSGESEVTAMLAGGIALARIVWPLAILGFLVSVVSLGIQEILVPIADDQATYLREAVIQHLAPAASNLTVVSHLPGGGRQVTVAGALDPTTDSLLDVTVLRYDRQGELSEMIKSARARYDAASWTFLDAMSYEFAPDGSVTGTLESPSLVVDIGERPDQVGRRDPSTQDPENLSRAEIADALAGGRLTPAQRRSFVATSAAKLARPFASLVFVLFAAPLGLRRVRGGGTPLGFGLAILIAFVYYVGATLFLAIGNSAEWAAVPAAWAPIVILGAVGLWLLRRASTAS
jgi:lipopolysaccharide export system permease protein